MIRWRESFEWNMGGKRTFWVSLWSFQLVWLCLCVSGVSSWKICICILLESKYLDHLLHILGMYFCCRIKMLKQSKWPHFAKRAHFETVPKARSVRQRCKKINQKYPRTCKKISQVQMKPEKMFYSKIGPNSAKNKCCKNNKENILKPRQNMGHDTESAAYQASDCDRLAASETLLLKAHTNLSWIHNLFPWTSTDIVKI